MEEGKETVEVGRSHTPTVVVVEAFGCQEKSRTVGS